MKIVKLQAQNIKNLKAVEITPDGAVVTLTGKNGAGKSAVLDAIYSGLTGTKLEDVVRHGQEKGIVEIDLGDFIVRRVYTGEADRLEVKSPDGLKYPSPQTMLNKLLGKLAFDPLAFAELKPKEQREALMRVAGLEFADLDEASRKAFDLRTEVNRTAKNFESQLGDWRDDPSIPDQEKSITEQMEKVRQMSAAYAEYHEIKRKNEENARRCQEINNDTEQKKKELRGMIQRVKEELEDLENELAGLEKTLPVEPLVLPLTQEVTLDQINTESAKVATIEEENKVIREYKHKRNLAEGLAAAKKRAEDLTTKIEQYAQQKKKRAESAEFPITGLAVDDDSVIYQDIPLQRLSTGQQIKVSTAIAMALNPTLKVILIREGSLLDQEGLRAIAALAQEKGYQVWIEKVEDQGGVGIHIEDGEVKNAQEAAQ